MPRVPLQQPKQPQKRTKYHNNVDKCRHGGTGRHAILRGWWPQGRVGSSPTVGTKQIIYKGLIQEL